MININYGETVSQEKRDQITELLKGDSLSLHTGISEDVILDMLGHTGEKVLSMVTGKTIKEASRCLPDNRDERIHEAAVLIKVSDNYRFEPTELADLIKYLDFYPMNPKITWGYSLATDQEQPVKITIFKILKSTKNETDKKQVLLPGLP